MSAPQPDFGTVSDADSAYYGDDGGGGGGDGSGRWGELQEKPTEWVAGWSLAYQESKDDPNLRRWFVIRVDESGQFQALSMSGTARDFSDDASLDELPHTNDEQEARQAYQAWVEANGPDGSTDESGDWSKWTKIQQVGDWWIWGREHNTEDRVQFMAVGKRQDGTTIWLHPDGSPKPERHIYDSAEAMQKALDAYEQKKQAGQIPEDEQPTGNSPSRKEITRGMGGQGGPVGGLVDAVGGPRNALLIGGVAVGGAYYLESRGYTDVTEAI